MKNFIFAFILISIGAFAIAAQDAANLIFYQSVAWSPDGKYLTVTAMYDLNQKEKKMKADIYTMRADGSDLKKITGDEANEFYSSWAKKRIVFTSGISGASESDIFTVNEDGSNLTQLTKNAKRNSTPDFSPNGKKIAFISTRDDDKYQIYVMNSDGSNVTRLTTDSTVAYFNPVFSPDGKKIVYYSEKGDGKDQIWVMNADGSNQTLLTNNIGHNIFPAFSHDGKKIIFSSSKRDANNDGSFVYTMNVDGSNLSKMSSISSFFARFSPDGKKIAYLAGKFPENSVYIANSDGSDAMKVTK